MEKVASHINEMQKIYEDYGCVFDQLAAEQSGADKQVNTMTHTHTLERHLCASRTLKGFFSSTLRWRRSRWGSFWSTRRWSGWTHCPLWVAWGRNQSWRCLVGEVSSSHFFTCTGNNWWRITQVCLCPQCSNEPSSWFTVRTANWRRRWWVHVYSSSPNLYNWTDLYVYLCQCKQKNTVTKKLTVLKKLY